MLEGIGMVEHGICAGAGLVGRPVGPLAMPQLDSAFTE